MNKPTIGDIKGLQEIAVLRNNWRQRFVNVYAVPDTDEVISVGYPMNPLTGELLNESPGGNPLLPVVCREKRSDYARAIALFPKTAIYD